LQEAFVSWGFVFAALQEAFPRGDLYLQRCRKLSPLGICIYSIAGGFPPWKIRIYSTARRNSPKEIGISMLHQKNCKSIWKCSNREIRFRFFKKTLGIYVLNFKST
jgi:hypothetical protein